MEMSENENIFDKLRELAGGIKGNFNILEDQVDVHIQMEYFTYSRKVKKKLDRELVLTNADQLFQDQKSLADKKHLLSQLASIDDVSAFRTIEKYANNPDNLLKSWAKLALQESKMQLESTLLDENQIIISTGLGGKGTNLRYFIVLFSENNKSFTDLHQKIIKNEFESELSKNNSIIEEIEYGTNYASLLALMPITTIIHNILKNAVNECNIYGNFVKENFIITNVKKLTEAEINEFIEKNKISGLEDLNETEDV
jgi:hypothetical protein